MDSLLSPQILHTLFIPSLPSAPSGGFCESLAGDKLSCAIIHHGDRHVVEGLGGTEPGLMAQDPTRLHSQLLWEHSQLPIPAPCGP